MLLNICLSKGEKGVFPVVLNGFIYLFILLLCLDFYVDFLGTRVALPSPPPPPPRTSVPAILILCLLHSPILSNCKVIGALKPPHGGGNLTPHLPRPPLAFQHLFLIPEITPLATTWGPHACHFEPH